VEHVGAHYPLPKDIGTMKFHEAGQIAKNNSTQLKKKLEMIKD
jgi:hypothetical protein